jgi:hypothetical protein
MRRSRYSGFYSTFGPSRSRGADDRPAVPSVSYAEIHRDLCRNWYPSGKFSHIVDAKQREWLVYDANSTAGFRYEYPLGSSQAIVRVFWREDHVREWRLTDASRATDMATLKRQLRYSRRVDFPEFGIRSPSAAVQDLYDSRRGTGRR